MQGKSPADSGSVSYDGNARPSSTTSPYGAVTGYTYADTASPPYKLATTNGHFVQTAMDGFGRTIQTNYGYGGSTIVSFVVTNYAPCGCSPLGKISQQSELVAAVTTRSRTSLASTNTTIQTTEPAFCTGETSGSA